MQLIGQELGRMHRVDIIHGDLTTSNMIVRRCSGSTQDQAGEQPNAAEIVCSPLARQGAICSGHTDLRLGF